MKDRAAKSEALKLDHKIIWQDLPQPRPVQEVSEMLDELLKSPSASSTSHDQIRKFLKQIEPFIFGYTPMYKASTDARAVFQNRNGKKKVMFILLDGDSTDGDPRPICEELHRSNITNGSGSADKDSGGSGSAEEEEEKDVVNDDDDESLGQLW